MKTGNAGKKTSLVTLALALAGGIGLYIWYPLEFRLLDQQSGTQIFLAEEPLERVFPSGLGIGIVPPVDMVVSQRFPGFEDEKHRSAIMMMEMPPELFSKLEKDLRDPEQEPEGFTLISREAWPVEGGKGFLLKGSQKLEGDTVYKWILAHGVPASASIVTFQVAEDARDTYTEDMVRKTLRSLAARDHILIQTEVSKLPFVVDETIDDHVAADHIGFRIARVIPGNSVMMTKGPKDLVQGAEQPVIVIGSGKAAIPGALEQDRFARQAFSNIPGVKAMQVRRGEGILRGNVSWHEIEADAEDAETGAKIKVIQAIRFERKHFIRFVAVMREDAEKESRHFLNALRQTVTLRDEIADE